MQHNDQLGSNRSLGVTLPAGSDRRIGNLYRMEMMLFAAAGSNGYSRTQCKGYTKKTDLSTKKLSVNLYRPDAKLAETVRRSFGLDFKTLTLQSGLFTARRQTFWRRTLNCFKTKVLPDNTAGSCSFSKKSIKNSLKSSPKLKRSARKKIIVLSKQIRQSKLSIWQRD